MYRYSRNANADNLSSFSLPPQLVDPSLRGGDGLFPNLRVGKFGNEALAEDLAPYRVAKIFRPDVINMNASNPRLAKATNDIQFQKAGQSPGQAKALGELIRKDPVLGNSFNVGYGSTLNREQGLAQKQGQVYEFDPSNEMWKPGFRRKNPDIVAMGDLQDALRTMPSGTRLTTYDGRPLDPSFTKAYYNLEATQDFNDPQLFFNLKSKSDVDYGRIAQALDSIPLDKTKKTDYSLAKRWERVQNYNPYPPSGATYVNNADKPYQNIDEIMADVNQVEVSRSPRMADSRIARSQNSGSSDNNNIPKDFTRKEYLEATGDSDPLPPVNYSGGKTLIKLSDWEYADRNGYPMHVNDVGRAMDNPSTTVEDRSFLLNSPEIQLPIRASASVLPPAYLGTDRQFGYYGNNRNIPTSLSALEEGLTGRKGSVVGYANARMAQRPSTRLEREEIGSEYFNPYRDYIPQGRTEIGDMYTQNFSDAGAEKLGATLGEDYYRMPAQNYSVGYTDNRPIGTRKDDGRPIYRKDFYSPEVILPASLATRVQRYTGNMGYSPNTYRKATLEGRDVNELDITKLSRREAAQLKDVGFYEFNDIMDEGVRTSKDIDRLYGLNDELAELSEVARSDDMYADILGYEQSNVMDKIVEAERKQQDMGGTYRALTGTQDQGAFEQERMAFENSPLPTQYNSDETIDSFNIAQYNRDLLKRGSILIDTQLGIPIAKAPTTAYDPVLGKNISYAQTVRPSRVIDNPLPWGPTDNTANWQAPESPVIGRVGKQIAVENIPELPTNNGIRMSTPQALGDIYGPPTPMRIATLPSREMIDTQGQVLYPNSGIGPINTGLKPKATIGELFGFSALTPEGLDNYKDMTLRY